MRFIYLMCMSGLPLFSALPPFAEAKRELKSILESAELPDFIPYGDVFEQIKKTEDGYIITTNKREIFIKVHYSKNSRIGPPEYVLEFND